MSNLSEPGDTIIQSKGCSKESTQTDIKGYKKKVLFFLIFEVKTSND